MCGILGLICRENCKLSFHDVDEIVKSLFKHSSSRGMQATGIAIKRHDRRSIDVLKKPENAKVFTNDKTYRIFFDDNIHDCFSPDGGNIAKAFSLIGHTRIATNGCQSNENNQPVIKNGAVGVHNGIICNIDTLWSQHSSLKRKTSVDTELLIGWLDAKLKAGESFQDACESIYGEIEGAASIGVMFDQSCKILLATNVGSLYYIASNDFFVFGSDIMVLEGFVEEVSLTQKVGLPIEIVRLQPGMMAILDELSLDLFIQPISGSNRTDYIEDDVQYQINDHSVVISTHPTMNLNKKSSLKLLLEDTSDVLLTIKRCANCVLPSTYPFISFDQQGVCNFCHEFTYNPEEELKGHDALLKQAEKIRNPRLPYDCIVMFSGGRDSSYGLHYVKEELGLNPIAYTFDWGVITDLGRRNQSLMCAKLGVEHILLSADINVKRDNVRKNIEAWMNKPHLGMIGLFMAGDKEFYYHAYKLLRYYRLPIIYSGHAIEADRFKVAFTGVKPSKGRQTKLNQAKIVSFFVSQFLTNPKYINASLYDSVKAFYYYYSMAYKVYASDSLSLFDYIEWDEKEVESVLLDQYGWETSPDTSTTWRIGDGTAAFYNYIYQTVCGFTESDPFRSNQIRLGKLSRDEAMKIVLDENKTRFESLIWYADVIGFDLERFLITVNRMPRLSSI